MGYYDKDQSTGGVTLKIPTGVVRKAVIEIEDTITGEPGTDALVENLGSNTEARLRFTIPQGATGERGEKGDKGDTGETGAQGPQGLQGDKGDKGDTGETGPQGPKGDTGETGAQGPQGPKGDTGEIGPQGLKGDKGDTGDDGFSPTVTISKAGTITTITITDANGPHTATIEDGDDYVLTAADKSDIADIVVQEIGSADTTAY
jgi:hypothetical protein